MAASVVSRLRELELQPATYRRVTLGALVALIVIIITGGAVRLTGSGLGCSEWPNCEPGQFVAPLEFHAWIEFGNRLFTGVVSAAVILAVLGSLKRVPRRRDLTLWSIGLVVGVLVQIVLGGIVVLTHLVPAAVSAHFLVSMVLVWNAVVLYVRAGEDDAPARPLVAPVVTWLTRAALVALAAVLFIGTLVTGSGPHSGDPGQVDRLGFEIRDITIVHTSAVWIMAAFSVLALVAAVRTGAPSAVRQWGWALLGVIAIQGSIGYYQYFNGVPALAVGLHLAGSVAVWVVALRFALAQRSRVAAGGERAATTLPDESEPTSTPDTSPGSDSRPAPESEHGPSRTPDEKPALTR